MPALIATWCPKLRVSFNTRMHGFAAANDASF
jgi:hypothetical protein